MSDHGWLDAAACQGTDPEIFFPSNGARYDRARAICSGCPVVDECLDEALRVEEGTSVAIRFGMFGGLTPEDRAELDRARIVFESDLDAGAFA